MVALEPMQVPAPSQAPVTSVHVIVQPPGPPPRMHGPHVVRSMHAVPAGTEQSSMMVMPDIPVLTHAPDASHVPGMHVELAVPVQGSRNAAAHSPRVHVSQGWPVGSNAHASTRSDGMSTQPPSTQVGVST